MIIALGTAIRTKLLDLHPRVYFEDAPKTAAMPYLEYSFAPSMTISESQEMVQVEIDGWDKPPTGDNTALDTIMGSLETLAGQVLTHGDVTAVLFLDNRLSIPDDNKQIKHRRYIFSAIVHRNEVEEDEV